MIPDYGRYYGCVFVRLAEERPEIAIRRLDAGVQGIYLLNDRLPLYIKFSRKRKGPWGFTFQEDHQKCCSELVSRFGECLTIFVCGHDGIVALDSAQLREILDENVNQQESVSIRRKLRHMYSVNGSDGKLSRKVGREALLELVDRALR